MNAIYYTLTIENDLLLHFWHAGTYARFSFTEDQTLFLSKLEWLTTNQTYYKIAYRGGHVEKPLMIAVQLLSQTDLSQAAILTKLSDLQALEGAPSKRLGQVLKDDAKDYYDRYLELLTLPRLLDIETFDGRIYHNRFDRLEIQAQLLPARSTAEYLQHLEIIFLTPAFQAVFQQKQYLLATFADHFHIPVNATTTDAQLTESFYTQGKLSDAKGVFIPKRFLSFTYFLKGDLNKLYQIYQMRHPKQAIKKAFGKNGALTVLGDFVISSAAAAPMGFQIAAFNPAKLWTNQTKPLHYQQAIRLDLTHIQAAIMKETVADTYFQASLGVVLDKWWREPDHRVALNRLLYPIQGTMDTPFKHDLQTPNYAYSMRMTHNLLVVGLLTTLVAEGMRPISLNNEVIFLELTNFNQDRFEQHLQVLNTYYHYTLVSQLVIKDTNNYTYYDETLGEQAFRGASFNHHEGADVTTNMDTPPIVDRVLQMMVTELGTFRPELIATFVTRFVTSLDADSLKEYVMVPAYPLKNRRQYLYRADDYREITTAQAYFASKSAEAWQYKQLYVSKSKPKDPAVTAFLQKYDLDSSDNLQEVAHSRLILEDIANVTPEKLDLDYYVALIEQEMALWL
ncbi:hypothetical protein [Weissella soli]|uniref:hypothetical protein n=1 Tax=Weissella soli TaxID=155866 RepID=UPI001F207F7A|nr:hypothetical protein [Weissella soli]GJM47839.1 hypothetical protein WSSLDB02_03960 [Weissella soli]